MDVKAMSVSMNPQLTFCLTMNYLWSFATKEKAFPLKPFSKFSVDLMCQKDHFYPRTLFHLTLFTCARQSMCLKEK